jgi:hypothetical protein
MPLGIRTHFISSGWSLLFAMAALPQVLRNIQIELIAQFRRARKWLLRLAVAAAYQASIVRGGRAEMSTPAGLDLASIPDRIQSEVQRAIQRTIKGVEYISSSGPSLGSTPKDILHVRGTMNLYHYRPIAEEIYRVPILIVMATTNRGYILDMVPGQSFIEFLLKRGYWTGPRPNPKRSRCGWKITSSTSFPIASAGCNAIPARPTLP